MAFDLYPLDSIKSRKQYYAQSILENWLTAFTHDAKTPWAMRRRMRRGRRWREEW